MNDAEIIKQILGGNKDSFRFLVERYQEMIFRTCMGFVHNREDAEDLTQEVFINAYRSLSGFKGEASFATWIYRIAVNASLNRVRKPAVPYVLQRIGHLFLGENEREWDLPDFDADDPESQIIRQAHADWNRNALDSLPGKQRTAIVLSRYEDLPQKRIAEIMGTTEGAVESLLQRAKANLRKKLSSYPKKNKNQRRKK